MSQRNVRERIVARVVYSGPVRPPVEKGQRIGTLKVWRGDSVALEVPLQAGEGVGRGPLSRRAFDAATELVIGLFARLPGAIMRVAGHSPPPRGGVQ
jgi:D-alanyl-D-alanine carboxypeptidase (penicillin-binding protein 5/6)